jgi:hypothetical protein
VHSLKAALREAGRQRKVRRLSACKLAAFVARRRLTKVSRIHVMNDRPANTPGPAEAPSADVEVATRRLMSALDALESAVERRREADRDEDELASRIQALGADRSRLADELDGTLVKSRKLERANREIAEKLDAAIGTIRAVLGEVTVDASMREALLEEEVEEDEEEAEVEDE